jgi:hypothetical protein
VEGSRRSGRWLFGLAATREVTRGTVSPAFSASCARSSARFEANENRVLPGVGCAGGGCDRRPTRPGGRCPRTATGRRSRRRRGPGVERSGSTAARCPGPGTRRRRGCSSGSTEVGAGHRSSRRRTGTTGLAGLGVGRSGLVVGGGVEGSAPRRARRRGHQLEAGPAAIGTHRARVIPAIVRGASCSHRRERVTGIEPAFSAWDAITPGSERTAADERAAHGRCANCNGRARSRADAG